MLTEEETREEMFERRLALSNEFKADKFSGAWYDASNLKLSMQRAVIICIAQHLVLLNGDAVAYREFLEHVLIMKPYPTSHRSIIDLTVMASQIVCRSSWEDRQELIKAFIINQRPGG